MLGFAQPVEATFTTNTQISNGQGFLQGEFAEVGVRANGAFGSTSVPSGFHANPANCLGFRVDREMDGWGTTTDDGDYFCPGSPFEGWQVKVGSSIGKNDHGQTGVAGSVSDIQNSGSSQCVSWNSASPYNGVSISQRYCVPTAGQALHTDVTLTNTTGSAVSDIYFGRGFDPDNATGSGAMTCASGTVSTSMFQSCNAVTGQGTEAQATARWGNNSFIALQSFDARARVARQAGGFSSPDPSDIWTAGNTLATSGTYLGNVGEMLADAGIYVALNVPTLGAGASTSFRISYVLSADGNNAPVLGAPVVSGIGQTSATVASTVNPKGFSTTAELVYSTDPDFGTSSSVSMGTFTGTDEVAIDAEITGLDPSETYYAKIVANNETGETESAVFDFETLDATAPIVSSEEPTVTVDDGPVTLSGTLNPNGFSSTAVFQYSTTSDFSGTVVDIPVSGTFTGTSLSTVSTVVSGLTGATTYYFRLKVTNASGSAYGSTISFVPADIPAPTSLVVTSLDDTTANGTLRWAITQANSTAGGIYDTITFGVDGTITLSSALPQITQNVTITGNGRTQTIIDGNNLHRIFNVPSGRSLTVSDMTLKQGQATNGGLIYNSQGTVVATNIRFTAMGGGSAVWNNNGGSRAVYTNCTFDFLNNGIAGDYGSTPQLAAGVTTWASEPDSVFQNRTYVDNCIFDNNNAGIYNYRFTRVNNSTFTNNGYAANITGLNRSQILNSTFSNNSIAVYHNAWIPTTFNMGTDNRIISGSTFTNNGTAIYLDDGYNNGRKDPRWATVTGNSWDEQGTWVLYYLWDGSSNVSGTVGFEEPTSLFTQSANLSVAPTTTTTTSTSTTTTTEVPTTTTEPEAIVVPVSPEPETIIPEDTTPTTGWTLPEEIETPKIEEEIIPETSVPDSTFDLEDSPSEGETVSGKEMDAILDDVFDSGASVSDIADSIDAILSADLTPKAFDALLDTAFSDDIDPELYAEVLDTMLSADLSDAELDKVLDSAFSATTSTETMVASLGTLLESGSTDVSLVMDAVFDADISVETAGAVVGYLLSSDLSISELSAVFDSVFDGDLSAEDTVAMAETILAEPLSDEEFSTVINAIFDEIVSDEVLVGTIGAVLDTPLTAEKFAEVVNVLENANITNDQVSQVVDLIVSQDGGVSSDQATELATSPKVLESIDGDQATEVFNAVVVAEVTEEAGAQIAEALIDAATEVKEAFEEEINVFAGVFDTYVALGSEINVGDRRTVIAVGAAVAIAGAASGMGGGAGGSPSSPNNNNPSNQNTATRKPDEETEASGEIAGDGVEWIAKLSVYKYVNGVKVFSLWGFMKKFTYGFLNMGFTIAGSLVVYLTLSGSIQTIAGVASVLAFAGAMYLHMKEPESE
jgi:hypothetical protein